MLINVHLITMNIDHDDGDDDVLIEKECELLYIIGKDTHDLHHDDARHVLSLSLSWDGRIIIIL